MAEYRLSVRAAADLDEIADYTIEMFGIDQARRYRDGLASCFERLADNPMMGRSAELLKAQIRRFEYRSHVVFYVLRGNGILIVRVLHASMDAPRHLREPI